MKSYYTTIILSLGLIAQTHAQGLFDSFTSETKQEEKKSTIELSGYARGSAYGGSENYDYANLFGEFALKGKLSRQKAFLFADVRFREGLFFNEREFQAQLKEAYVGFTGDRLDLYLGNQIVSWGRTDGFNPTNSITPNDYFLLTHEPDDQKLSNFMLRGKYRFAKFSEIEVIAIPAYKPSVYRYDLFGMGAEAHFMPVELPEAKFENSTAAARLNFELPKAGFSLSFFHGYDPFYGFSIIDFSLSPILINYLPTPYLKNSFGVDFAVPIKSWIFRGEASYNHTSDYEENMHIPNPDIYYVVGVEKSLFDITAIFQFIGRFTFDFKELTEPTLSGFTPEAILQYANDMISYESTQYIRKIFNQHEVTNHAVMLSLSRSFLFEEFRTEMTGYYNLTTKEYMLRPSLKWSINDNLSATFGGHFMKGPEGTIFDTSGRVMNGAFLGLMVSF